MKTLPRVVALKHRTSTGDVGHRKHATRRSLAARRRKKAIAALAARLGGFLTVVVTGVILCVLAWLAGQW